MAYGRPLVASWTPNEKAALAAGLGIALIVLVVAAAWARRGDDPNRELVFDACVEAIEDQLATAPVVTAERFDDEDVEALGGSRYAIDVHVSAVAEDGDDISGDWRCVMEPHPSGSGWALIDLSRD